MIGNGKQLHSKTTVDKFYRLDVSVSLLGDNVPSRSIVGFIFDDEIENEYEKGFTLIEVLVAISIFSILSALAYGTLNQTITSSEKLEDLNTRMQSLQRGFSQIDQDYIQLAKRPIRSEIGNTQIGAMTSNHANGYLIEFSRHGWPNRLGMKEDRSKE